MEKEEQLFGKRVRELAEVCARRDIPTHTDFLTLAEQAEIQKIKGTLPPVRYGLTGGFLASERKLLYFLPSYLETLPFDMLPFSCVRISPVNARFAEELTHRDFLGALMNLGMTRAMIGDIVQKDGAAYAFLMKKLCAYVCENLTTVRHTTVRAEIFLPDGADGSDDADGADRTADAARAAGYGFDFLEPEFEEICGSVSSLRLDGIVALAGRLSRAKAAELIAAEKVAVNGREALSASLAVKDGDILSLRGIGKFRFAGSGSQTKKGRTMVTLLKYK